MKRTLAVLSYGCTKKEYEKNCMIVRKLLWERAAIESMKEGNPDYDNVEMKFQCKIAEWKK